eukprot:251666_1
MHTFLVYLLLWLYHCESATDKPRCPGLDVDSGWSCDYITNASHRNGDYDFCDFDIIPLDFPIEKFNELYLLKKPVLIDSNWHDWLTKNISFYFKASLSKHFGSYSFDSGRSLDLVLNAGVGKIKTTLNDYIQQEFSNITSNNTHIESLYIFDRSLFKDYSALTEYFHPPPYLNQIPHSDQYGVFFIGPSGTGATWHAHGETWQGSIFGRKRWSLYPPELTPVGGFFPGYSASDWFNTIYDELDETIPTDYESNMIHFEYPFHSYKLRKNIFKRHDHVNNKTTWLNSASSIHDIIKTDSEEMNSKKRYGGLYKPLECMVKEGQMLYIPEFWWHSVVNVGNSIGIAVQSARYYTPWMQIVDRLQEYEEHKVKYKQYTDLERDKIQFDILNIHETLDEMGPQCAVHTFFIGEENIPLSNLKTAEQYLIKTIRMDPTFVGAYVSLSKVYAKLNEMDKAETLLRIGYVLNRHHPQVREELIQLFEVQQNETLKQLVEQYQDLPPR